MLSDILDRLARRGDTPGEAVRSTSPKDPIAKAGLLGVTEILAEHSPDDFENAPDAAFNCINVVRWIEDDEYWRAGYKSLDSRSTPPTTIGTPTSASTQRYGAI